MTRGVTLLNVGLLRTQLNHAAVKTLVGGGILSLLVIFVLVILFLVVIVIIIG